MAKGVEVEAETESFRPQRLGTRSSGARDPVGGLLLFGLRSKLLKVRGGLSMIWSWEKQDVYEEGEARYSSPCCVIVLDAQDRGI